jgi:hypothetical protein
VRRGSHDEQIERDCALRTLLIVQLNESKPIRVSGDTPAKPQYLVLY